MCNYFFKKCKQPSTEHTINKATKYGILYLSPTET